MKNKIFFLLFLYILLSVTIYAEEYRWDLIDAFAANDFEKVDNILRTNIRTMSATDKRLVMNFAINYSTGENTARACELLLKYDIRPNAFDLYTAINRNRQNSAIQFLVQNGAVPNGEILLLTMERQRFDLAKQFIESGTDVNYQYPLTRNDADGMTPLLYAAKWGNFELVKLLVEKGANINSKAVNGDTVLSLSRNNGDIHKFLLDNGAIETVISLPAQSSNQSSGIVNHMDGISTFQTGSYRLSGSNRFMSFSGNTGSGTISYVDMTNNRYNSGFYRITGNTLTITVEGYSSMYRIDSNESFSGNGETWNFIGR